MNRKRVINVVAFVALMASTALGFQSLWGVLFLYWTVLNLTTGHAFLISEVTRAQDPILFWLIQVAWVVFGLMLIAADVLSAWS